MKYEFRNRVILLKQCWSEADLGCVGLEAQTVLRGPLSGKECKITNSNLGTKGNTYLECKEIHNKLLDPWKFKFLSSEASLGNFPRRFTKKCLQVVTCFPLLPGIFYSCCSQALWKLGAQKLKLPQSLPKSTFALVLGGRIKQQMRPKYEQHCIIVKFTKKTMVH